MKLKHQKRLAAQLLKCSEKRIKFNKEHLDDVKEAITKTDIKGLINDKVIKKIQAKGVSRVRARKRHEQRRKGRQKGHGKRKGKATARMPKKKVWMNLIRKQREFLKELKEKKKITTQTYRMLYMKSKGGFFRSKNHIKLYIDEHKLGKNKK